MNGISKIEIDEVISRGVYSNMGLIFYRDTEFIIDNLLVQPSSQNTKVVSRVIMSPLHAKRLLAALAFNISKYESIFGIITDSNPPKFEEEAKSLVS